MTKFKFEKWNIFMLYDDEDKKKWHRIAIPEGLNGSSKEHRTDILPSNAITRGYEYNSDAIIIFTNENERTAYQHGKLLAIIQK